MLDAFSSDAIPLHLLTREALELYLARLAPGGVLAFHISNRHLGLEPVPGGSPEKRHWSRMFGGDRITSGGRVR